MTISNRADHADHVDHIGQLAVSRLCMGTMYFGTTIDEPTAHALLDQFVDAGGTFIDTANCYSFWAAGGVGDESELVLGRWIARRGGHDDLVVATKVGRRPAFPGASWPEQSEGLASDTIRSAVEASLARLGIDRVDLLYTHHDDRAVPLEEVLAALEELRSDGRVIETGCSNIAAWRISEAIAGAERLGITGYRCVQLRHTFLRPHPDGDLGTQVVLGDEHRDLAAAHPELRLLGYSPALQGAYTARTDRPLPPEYDTDDNRKRLARLSKVAADTGATELQVVLAWILHKQPTVIPVIGASTRGQLTELLDASQIALTAEQMELLDAPALG
jgi:aryl-alcohol dehydrogenase-like predicted oxidoreductase